MEHDLSAEVRWLETLGRLPLYEWQDPLAFIQFLSPPEGVAGWDFNADSKFKKHREAWVASRFAAGYAQILGEPVQIKMVPEQEQTPDAILKLGVREIPLDVTIILEPGRRFSEEYKEKIGNEESGQEDSLHMRQVCCPNGDEAEKWLVDALNNKALTAYPGLWLLVYFDVFGGKDITRSETPVRAAAPWEQVCILDSRGWSGEYALLFLRGEHCPDWTPFQLNEPLEE